MTKTKKCKVCQQKFLPRFSTLQPICEGFKCIMEWKRLAEEKAWQKRKKETKEKLKSLSEYEAEAKKSFQKWIRLRDEGMPCISCGTPNPQDAHGSHYFEAGKYSGLIFNPINCHKSCKKCNVFLSGNLLEYRKGLVERYGIAYVEKLESLSDESRCKKYTKEELIQVKKTYDNLIKAIIKSHT